MLIWSTAHQWTNMEIQNFQAWKVVETTKQRSRQANTITSMILNITRRHQHYLAPYQYLWCRNLYLALQFSSFDLRFINGSQEIWVIKYSLLIFVCFFVLVVAQDIPYLSQISNCQYASVGFQWRKKSAVSRSGKTKSICTCASENKRLKFPEC